MEPLIGVTNETGYAVFDNAINGSYTFSIVKEGLDQFNQSINFKGKPVTYTIMVSSGTAPSTDNSLLIAAVIVVVVIVAVICSVLVIKRKRNRRPKIFEPPRKSPNPTSQLPQMEMALTTLPF